MYKGIKLKMMHLLLNFITIAELLNLTRLEIINMPETFLSWSAKREKFQEEFAIPTLPYIIPFLSRSSMIN